MILFFAGLAFAYLVSIYLKQLNKRRPVHLGIELVGNGIIPKYKTPGAACADIYAAGDEHTILPGSTAKIPTGIKLDIPHGWEVQVRSRSGLASRGIFVANQPGCIDSDYKKEIFVLLHNTSMDTFSFSQGTRIAQICLAKTPVMNFVVGQVIDNDRGGFGSTGFL